jgi:hypothetical protein
METCAALSLLALFIAVFVTLSSRLATAQSQQAARAAALGYLQGGFEDLKQQGPSRWALPYHQEYQQQGTTFTVDIEEGPEPLVTDHSFGRLLGKVSWSSMTGKQKIEREVWVHEHLQ